MLERHGRFRMNVFRQLGSIAVALRFIPDRVYSLEELGAPPIARDLALLPRGLVLLTGPTGRASRRRSLPWSTSSTS